MIPPELAEQLRQFARKRKVTLFTALFAAFISLIHVFSGYRYNFFCFPVANRTLKETQSLIGCFMNFQFVHIDLYGNPSFMEIIERLNRRLHDVYENYVPFRKRFPVSLMCGGATVESLANAIISELPLEPVSEIQPKLPESKSPLFFVHSDINGGGLYTIE